MTKFKPNTKYNPNEVDSGFIYSELRYNAEKFSPKFFTIFKGSLMGLLIEKKIITVPYNDETKQLTDELSKYWNQAISKTETQNDVDYFCFSTPELGDFITSYLESCTVVYGDTIFGWDAFDLYFALKLNFTDLIKLDDFLDYQLENYFKDVSIFKRFLEQIVRKYKSEVLSKEVIETVNTWIPKKNSTTDSPVSWIGTNETEFVQFIYALKEAGLIKHESNETGKLVESLAQLFNFELGQNWPSNFSTSINGRNSDYVPKVFDNLKKSYIDYANKIINKKKNK
jgi:hypothetical protein